MSNKKVLFGLRDSKIIAVDVDTSVKAKKLMFREGCTSVIVAELTESIREKWIEEIEVSISDFNGIEF